MPTRSDDRDSGRRASPNYVRVRDWLLDHIVENRLVPGDRVPSERVLTETLSLSRPTIARAILELVEQGVLTREQGNGTFVSGRTPRPRHSNSYTVVMLLPFTKDGQTGEVADTGTDSSGDGSWTEYSRDGTLHGMISVLKQHRCRVVVHHTNSAEEESAYLSGLRAEGLDGAVVLSLASPEKTRDYSRLAYAGPPLVFVDRYLPDVPIDRVVTDNQGGAKEAVSYLISKGHRRIAYFTNFANITSITDREAGYRAALETAGLPYDEDIVCGPEVARYGQLSFEHSLKYCVEQPDPVTAVFCLNDDIVWAALHAAEKLGLGVPDDLEVAGFFDSASPMSILGSVTRVVQERFKIGQIAAQLLWDRLCGEAPTEPRAILVPPKLIPAIPKGALPAEQLALAKHG